MRNNLIQAKNKFVSIIFVTECNTNHQGKSKLFIPLVLWIKITEK